MRSSIFGTQNKYRTFSADGIPDMMKLSHNSKKEVIDMKKKALSLLLSLVLILIFCVRLRWLPSSVAYSVGKAKDLADRAVHLILPLVVVILGHLWYYAYLIRNRLLEEVRADYVLLCKSKGLSKGQILFGHCLRNTLPTYISLMAISVPHILGGTYIVETVFSYPGVGTLSYEAARMADYNMLMVLSMLTGVTVIFCNLLGQIINERIDPRIRAEEEREVARNG